MEKVVTLKNGIEIELNELGLRPWITKDKSKYMSLSYGDEFYLNLKGFWLVESEMDEYQKELLEMIEVCKEANQLLKEGKI